MNLKYFIEILALFLTSCTNTKVRIQGYWQLVPDEFELEKWPPGYVKFQNDSFWLWDDNYFSINGTYQLEDESICFYPAYSPAFSIPMALIDEETIRLNKAQYFAIPDSLYQLPPSYKLVQFKSDSLFIHNNTDDVIQLISLNGKAKVILNDGVKDLTSIGQFISSSHDMRQLKTVALLVGENSTLKDLIEVYREIYIGLPNARIKLITDNRGIDSFFYIKDEVLICDKSTENTSSPMCYWFEDNSDSFDLIQISKASDIEKLRTFSSKRQMLIYPDTNLDIHTYLALKKAQATIPKSYVVFKLPID